MDDTKSPVEKNTAVWGENERLRAKLLDLFDTLVAHPGFGEMHISVKILRHGKKEIILSCGKQYRYVLQPISPPIENN